MYSQDGLGLGHFRRSTNIAEAILGRDPGARILILADSPASPFAPTKGIDVVKLPTVVKSAASSWTTGSLGIDLDDAIDIRRRLIVEAYRAFRPDTVLVDHMPAGALGELVPMLDLVADDPRRPRAILGLRDIIDAPETVRRVWHETGAYEQLERYDSVLIYGSRDLFDAETAYDLGRGTNRVEFCNYVARPAHRALGVDKPPTEPFVLMMGGGGHDAAPLARTFLETAPSLARARGLGVVVVAGPTMDPLSRIELLGLNGRNGTLIVPSVGDPQAWIRDAAAVVTMAGYNSMCEVVGARKPALVVPRRGPSQEQRMRSRLFADRNLIGLLDPDDLSPLRLFEGLEKVLVADELPVVDAIPPLDGVDHAADRILSWATVS